MVQATQDDVNNFYGACFSSRLLFEEEIEGYITMIQKFAMNYYNMYYLDTCI